MTEREKDNKHEKLRKHRVILSYLRARRVALEAEIAAERESIAELRRELGA